MVAPTLHDGFSQVSASEVQTNSKWPRRTADTFFGFFWEGALPYYWTRNTSGYVLKSAFLEVHETRFSGQLGSTVHHLKFRYSGTRGISAAGRGSLHWANVRMPAFLSDLLRRAYRVFFLATENMVFRE